MEKNVKVSILCQIYGKLLTKKQFEIITDYYDNDLSLSEIAENNQITRQAVRDIIKKAEEKLKEAGVVDFAVDSWLLAEFVFKINRTGFIWIL